MFKVINWAKLGFEKWSFFVFLLFKMCRNTYFYSVFPRATKIYPKSGPKKGSLFTFCKTQVHEKNCCNDPFDQKLVVFNLGLLKPRTLMLNKKHNLISAKKKIRERDSKEKDRKPNKKRKNNDEKKVAIECFDVVPFMKQKQRRKTSREKQGLKRKQKGKTRRKKQRKEQEIDRESEIEKGGGQKG